MSNISESCYLDVPSPTYDRYVFPFERNFDYWFYLHWYQKNWYICFYIIGAYLMIIAAGQRFMRSRPAFDLRRAVFLWNILLALTSITITARMLPENIYSLRKKGFYVTLCDSGSSQTRAAVSFWMLVFFILKVVELGDTAFIVLRKKPLIFLHWYHHSSVLLFTWGNSPYPSAIHWQFMAANATMHSFVYSYFALKALRVAIPRRVNIMITTIQIFEMMYGVFVCYSAYWEKVRNPDCCVFDQVIKIAVGIYASYFLLFVNFFIKSYIVNKGVLFDEKGNIKKLA